MYRPDFLTDFRTTLKYALGTGLVLFVSILLPVAEEYQGIKSDFNRDIQQVNRQLTQQIASLETILTSLSGLHHASDDFNHAELGVFTEEMINAYPFINAVLSMQKINDIRLFEKEMHKNGFINLKFKTHTASSGKQNNPIFLPVNFIEPMTPLSSKLLGLDILSVPEMAASVNTSIKTGKVVSSKISTSFSSEKPALLMLKALYLGRYPPTTPADRVYMLDSLVALKINIDEFTASLSLKKHQLHGSITNATEASDNTSEINSGYFFSQNLQYRESLEMYGQRYQLTLTRPLSHKMFSKWKIFLFSSLVFLLFSLTVITLNKRKQSEEEIRRLAYFDSLTNLPNRESFKKQLQSELDKPLDDDISGAILFMDIDEFKRINDTLGHDIGDELLIQVSNRLTKHVRQLEHGSPLSRTRSPDFVTRLGGDEFTVILSGIEKFGSIETVANRIQQSISQPFNLHRHEVFVTLSIGIAVFPRDGNNVDNLLKNADIAMYHAKEIGKNNYQFYSHKMSSHIEERLKLEGKLRQALEKNEMQLFYQPQIDTKTNKIVGAEALIRWEQSELGMVFPDQFIPLAEETGQILKIGEWVIQEACRQNKAWQNAGHEPIRVAVNLSGIQFTQEELSETINDILIEQNLDPKYLELEITESIMMENIENAISIVNEFTRMNLSVSIDDFGTGYSSLNYLKKFPIESLKIDRSFVSDIPLDHDDMMITSAIISMAKSLNLKVVAEGVENKEQVMFLKEHECDFMQGYYFSRPLPADEFEKLLQQQAASTRLVS